MAGFLNADLAAIIDRGRARRIGHETPAEDMVESARHRGDRFRFCGDNDKYSGDEKKDEQGY